MSRGEAMSGLLDAAAQKRTARIRGLNDAFRTTFGGGQVVMTSTVAELPEMVRANALVTVARFDAFDGSNDPYQEHDFGAFEFCGRTFFWKIDYFDTNLEFGSEDPADPEKTKRVLTLMLAEDY
jgi:Protein of unknown function (DUF3768)